MNTASEAAKIIDELNRQVKAGSMSYTDAIWEAGKMCIGWPYVFGAAGKLCEKDGKQVRCFDCRGFTRWTLGQFGIELYGGGCTSQWNTESNWKAKGRIRDGIPDDTLVCLFYSEDGKEKKWLHTGFGLHGQVLDCSTGVTLYKKRTSVWTHWAMPNGIGGDVPDFKPTLRKGNKGEYVKLLQTKLVQLGYDIGKTGVDGSYGRATEAAVKLFQKDNGLVADGIVGRLTWAALDGASHVLYTVTIPHLTHTKAEELQKQYVGAWITEENDA